MVLAAEQRYTEAAIAIFVGDGHGHAGRQGGAPHQDHDASSGWSSTRSPTSSRSASRPPSSSTRSRWPASGRAAWLGRLPVRDLRRPAPRALQRVLGRDRPALLRRAADPRRRGHRGRRWSCSWATTSSSAGWGPPSPSGPTWWRILMVTTFRYYSFKEIDFARRRPDGDAAAGRARRPDRRHAPAVVPVPALLSPTS